MTTRRKAFIAILISFILGSVVGAVGYSITFHAMAQRQPPGFDRFRNDLHDRLGLTAAQGVELDSILNHRKIVFDKFRRDMRDQFSGLLAETRDSIRKVLTEEQKSKFEKFIQEMDREREKREGGSSH